jgi:hypothetical protein
LVEIFGEALALRVLAWLFGVWRRARPMTPERRLVRAAQRDGKAILHDVELAPLGDERSLVRLTRRVVEWYGDFEIALNEANGVVYERYKNPLLPSPESLDDLAESIRTDLLILRRIERYFVWPARWQRFLLGRETV